MERGCKIHVLEYFDRLPQKMFLQVKNKAYYGQPYFVESQNKCISKENP